MQYQSECLEALKSAAKISKPFEKVFMDTLKLFMAIPGKVNFLQMGRYGEFSEQTYRNNFANETFEKPPRKPHTDHRLISVIFAYRHIINPIIP